MTTLPQNPPVRIPRPPGAGGAPVTGGGAPPSSGMTGADVLRVLRTNVLLIGALLISSAVIGFFANMYLARNFSRFTASGFLEVKLPATMDLLGRPQYGMSDTAMAIEQRTQVQSLRNEALYSRVLQNQNSAIRNTGWFKDFGNNTAEARQNLLKNFSANAIQDTRLISVSMQFSDPEEARIIVQEVVDQFLREQSQNSLDANFSRTQQLQTMKLRLEADLRAVQQDRKEQANRLNQEGLPVGTNMSVSTLSIEVDAATKNLIDAQQRAAMVKSQLDQVNTALAAGQDPAPIVRMISQDPDFMRAEAQMRELELAYENLRSRGENNPQVQDFRRRLEGAKQRLEETRKDMLAKYKLQVTEDLQSQAKSSTDAVTSLEQRLNALKNRAGELSNLQAQFEATSAREAAIQSQLGDVARSLDSANMTGGASGPVVEWRSRPIRPELPSFPKLSSTLSMAVAAGLALALGISFLRELLDTTIRSPRDIAKVGPIAVLGMVPHEDDDPQSAGARLPLVIAEAPQSMTAEQLRQLRTRLQNSTSLDTTRSLLITSANPGEGKTTIAANLAAGLALVGRRILLVDANFRRPELHKLFGVDNATGFGTVLAAPDQLATVAKTTKIPNLSVLAAGPKPANATEMLESSLLHDFIEKALENYDHVVFDSGPLLFASETVAMAPKVDGVITVVRARQSTRGVLGRVKDMLRQNKAESLGVVINGVRSYGGGYYGRNIKTYYEYSATGNG